MRWAIQARCCTRWTLLAKQVTTTRPRAAPTSRASASVTTLSLRETPGSSAFVAVGQERQDPFVTQRLEPSLIRGLAARRLVAQLEVRGVEHPPDRRADREHLGLRDRVGRTDRLDRERAEGQRSPVWGQRPQTRRDDRGVLGQAGLEQASRVGRRDHRHVLPREHVGDARRCGPRDRASARSRESCRSRRGTPGPGSRRRRRGAPAPGNIMPASTMRHSPS